MYHSITFGDKNTYDDWKLAPSSRPVFNPPKQKTKYIDIPGASGSLDMTESLTGFPVFENAEGSIEFYVLNGYNDWATLYSEIMGYLHGREMKAILEDDPSYYREGRFTVNKWKSDSYWSKITIDYNVNPYKWKTESSMDDWIWDSFNFETDVIQNTIFTGITVNDFNNWKKLVFTEGEYGTAPVTPTFIAALGNEGLRLSPLTMRFINSSMGIDETVQLGGGKNIFYQFMFVGPRCEIYLKGQGSLSIYFHQGRL